MSNDVWAYYQNYFDKIGKSKDNIIHVNNFMSQDEINMTMEYINKYRDDTEFSGGKTITIKKINQENPELFKIITKYGHRVYDLIKENYCKKYDIKVKEFPWNPFHIVKWQPEMSSGLHSDCQYPDGSPLIKSNYFKLNITALIYPNDDYVGGEIGWPDYDLEIKPKAGDMVLFPANNYYLHYVNNVVSGLRFTLPTWYTFDIGMEVPNLEYNSEASKNLWVNEGEDSSHLRQY
jgi:hypothetical protein